MSEAIARLDNDEREACPRGYRAAADALLQAHDQVALFFREPEEEPIRVGIRQQLDLAACRGAIVREDAERPVIRFARRVPAGGGPDAA